MPQYNTTIEDFSPIITYSSDWRAGTSADSLYDLYSDSSFTLTQVGGGTATFIYNGTGFTIFGSKRGNHGLYQVTVDGNSFPPDNGEVADPGQFQVPLFTSPPLAQGLHTVTLTNQGTTFVDIDFITWESSVGVDDEQLIVNTVQDSDPSFVYTPGDLWGTNPPNLGTYSGSSGHGTATPGAFMTYTFTVDGVSLYGPVGPDASPFTVTMDGGPPVNHTANKQFYQPQVLLYSATNLGSGEHVVKVEYQPSEPGQIFAIDYANVFTAPSLQPTNSPNSSNGLPSAAVAGIVIALLFILFILAALLIFLRRRRNRKNRTSLESPMIQPIPPNSGTIVAPLSMYSPQPRTPYPVSVVPSSTTRPNSYVLSASSDSEYLPSSHYGIIRAPEPLVKGQPSRLPPTAGQSLFHIPTAELRANRKVVPGRTQDFGPAPPDYVQATESFGGRI
ncbi:hypothetical protein DFH07DRAFT_853604 [Mycena maculata]|uniref:Transmembrane protein n=1 Tax=Mycena maculata TaxID=230809 RepID=A0AAD7HQE0_9AGAR|nr:hypothetical protein DFH07DRAFT_853604 [Mycena maculata]